MRFIGIDLGTTFIKGGILDLATGALSDIERLPFPDPIAELPARHFEVDPVLVATQTRSLIKQLAYAAPDAVGIVMCSQMHGLVLMDERGGAIGNAITWRDERSLDPAPEGGTYYDAILRLSHQDLRVVGNELKPGRPLCALYWLSQMGQLPPGAIAASLPDFIVAHLCGSPPMIEPTNASAHGAFDVRAGDWHGGLIQRLGLSAIRFPSIARYTDVAGHMDIFSRSVPMYAPIGDQQAALAGAGLRLGELSLNISTGSQASVLSDLPRTDSDVVQVRPYFDGLFLHTITHIPAGRALNVLVALLGELAEGQGTPLRDPWAQIAELSARADDTDLSVDLSFFGGAGVGSADGIGGSIRGIREDNLTAGALFRAAFRTMAASYAACADQLSSLADLQRIAFSGGLALRVAALREIIVSRLGMPYRLSRHEEDTLMGLLAVARVCSGQAKTIAAANARLGD